MHEMRNNRHFKIVFTFKGRWYRHSSDGRYSSIPR